MLINDCRTIANQYGDGILIHYSAEIVTYTQKSKRLPSVFLNDSLNIEFCLNFG